MGACIRILLLVRIGVRLVGLLLLLLVLLFLELLQLAANELPVEPGVFVAGIELEGAIEVAEGLFPGLLALLDVLGVVADAVERAPEVVVGLFLEIEVGRGEGIVEIFAGSFVLAGLVGGGAGVVHEARIAGALAEEAFVFAQGEVVLAGLEELFGLPRGGGEGDRE